MRLSGYYSRRQGDLDNAVPDSACLGTRYDRLPRSRDYALRGTMKWAPTDTFDARLKVNFAKTRHAGPAQAGRYVSCPFGYPNPARSTT